MRQGHEIKGDQLNDAEKGGIIGQIGGSVDYHRVDAKEGHHRKV
jgi:hypothetical protein